MRLRLLLSFLLGTVFFTVLPFYAPPILLQTNGYATLLVGPGCGGGRGRGACVDQRIGAGVIARAGLRVRRRLIILFWVSHTQVRVGFWGPLDSSGRRLLRSSPHSFLPVLGPPGGRRRG